MSIEEKLYSILSPVFGTEIYPVIHPDPEGTETDVAELYAITHKVGGQVYNTLKGTAALRRPRMQISIYGINFDNVVVKEQAVIAAMDAANDVASQAIDDRNDPLTVEGSLPNTEVGVPIDDYEKDTKRFVKILEYYCWANA